MISEFLYHGSFKDYVLGFALERIRMGERIVLVTLVQIDGSSPRPLGAQMVVSDTGEHFGYLSGGCIEHAVVSEALDALAIGQDRRIRYGKGSPYLDIQLPCGSAIELAFSVDPPFDRLSDVSEELKARRPASLALNCDACSPGEGASLVCHYTPRRRLIVAGAGPSAVRLALLAASTEFEVHVYSHDRGTLKICEEAGIRVEALRIGSIPAFHVDKWTAFACMFHDHEWETDLIPAALQGAAFYVGAMGSRKAHAQRLQILQDAGVSEEKLSRIRAPAGLFPAAKSADEIAVSILAEVMQLSR